jgi:CheY-like chemotaxis protein
VEDDEDTRDLLVELLEETGYAAEAVANGAAALEILHARMPSLILSDYLLGDMNGAELRRRIRASFGAKAPAFVLLTGFPRSRLEDISGVIIEKPIDGNRLLEVVAQHYDV